MGNDAEALRGWLRGCPELEGASLGADYLGAEAGCWALSTLPGETQSRENILGERRPLAARQRDYLLALRGRLGASPGENLENLGALRRVEAWIEAQSAAGRLPEWEGGRATAALVWRTGAAEAFDGGTARYQLRLRIWYERTN